jgi:hypothetical protein
MQSKTETNICMTTVLYGGPYDIGISAYAIPYSDDPWNPKPWIKPPYPTTAPNPFLPTLPNPVPKDNADSLLDRCKRRLAEIEALLAQHENLEVEAETLRKMIAATEKNK